MDELHCINYSYLAYKCYVSYNLAMKTLLIILLISTAFAQTQMGELILKLQQNQAQFNNYPIVILDRDELGWRFATQDAFADEDLRIKILQQFIEERTGHQASFFEAQACEPYITLMPDAALALPINDYTSEGPQLCAVFPPSANNSQRILNERIMGFMIPNIFDHTNFEYVIPRMEHEPMLKYSLYHELSHCLDNRYLLASNPGMSDIHKAESFADSMALLMLAQEGYKKLGKNRSMHRALYSRFAGPYFAAHPELSMGSPTVMYGGAIYFLSYSLDAAQKFINWHPFKLKKMSIEDLRLKTYSIVEKNAVDHRSLSAIYYLFQNDPQEALVHYQEMKDKNPDLFTEAYQDLQKYVKYTDKVIAKSFDDQSLYYVTDQQLSEFSLDQFCPSFRAGDKAAFFKLLEQYRSELQATLPLTADQYPRASQLDNIWKDVAENCQ